MFDARLHQTNGGIAAESLRPVLPGREECPLFAQLQHRLRTRELLLTRWTADLRKSRDVRDEGRGK